GLAPDFASSVSRRCSSQANDTVHLPRRLGRRRTPKSRDATAVRCNGWFAGPPQVLGLYQSSLLSEIGAATILLRAPRSTARQHHIPSVPFPDSERPGSGPRGSWQDT